MLANPTFPILPILTTYQIAVTDNAWFVVSLIIASLFTVHSTHTCRVVYTGYLHYWTMYKETTNLVSTTTTSTTKIITLIRGRENRIFIEIFKIGSGCKLKLYS
jgi:hypothetical protein